MSEKYIERKLKISANTLDFSFQADGYNILEYLRKCFEASGLSTKRFDDYFKKMRFRQNFLIISSDDPIEVIENDIQNFISDEEMNIE